MAKIDELLQELCPDGVERKTIKELFETRNGYTPSTKNSSFWTNGDIPWFKMEDIRDKGHILSDAYSHITKSALKGKGLFKANSIILATSATIGEHALITVDHLSNQRFTNIYPKEKWVNKIHMKFVYYYMYLIDEWCKTHIKQGSFAAVDMDGFYKQEIPIPPLSIQQEIVEVLDTFTDAISNLEEELALREKQFEYYREQLFNFDEGEYEWKYLPDISINCDKQRKAVSSKNRNSGIYPYYGASGVVDHVNDYIFDGEYLLISEDGANLCTRVYPIAFSIKGKNWVNNHAHVIKFDNYVLQKFTEIYLNSLDLRPWISTGAQPKLNQDNLNKIRIPVPSLERLQEIVEILDTFEAMIANIKEEIALRTKQYEYYREKLLSFGK